MNGIILISTECFAVQVVEATCLRVLFFESLRQAAVDRDSATIESMLKNCDYWQPTDNEGKTALQLVFKNKVNILANQQAIIQTLQCFLDKGLMNVNFGNRRGRTVLFSATKSRLRDVIDFLVSRGADLDVRDEYGDTIVHLLIRDQCWKYNKGTIESQRNIEREDIDFMNWLLSKGINVDCKNNNGKTALHLAMDYHLIHVVPILIKFINDAQNHVDKDGRTIVEYFIERNRTVTSKHVNIAKCLLSKGFSVDHIDNMGNTVVHTFLKLYDDVPKIVRWMLQRCTNVDARDVDGNTALHIIIIYIIEMGDEHEKSTIDYVRILLSKGANVYLKNYSGDTAVGLAVRFKHMEVLNAMSEYGVDLGPSQNPEALLLHEISKRNFNDDEKYVPVVDILVRAGWDVNAVRPDDQFTPLMAACRSSCPAIAQKLIDNGANVNYVEDRNLTRPVHAAAMANFEDSDALFQILAKAGANLNAKNIYGVTALHIVSRDDYSATKTLLHLGADVDVRDDCGRSPLYNAVQAASYAGIRALFVFGADVNDEDVLRILNEQKNKGLNDVGTVTCVMEQWLKLKATDLPVLSGFANFSKEASFQEFYVECLKEVETLKTHTLNKRTTLYALLHMDVRERYFSIANNDSLKNLVESSSLESIFPKYQTLILAHYRKAVARHPLIEPARRAWYYLTEIELPDICVRQILFHLKNEDLRLMAEEDDEMSDSLKQPSQLKFDKSAKKKRLS